MKHYKIVNKYNSQGEEVIKTYKRKIFFFWKEIFCKRESVFAGQIRKYTDAFKSIEEAQNQIEKEKEIDKIRNKIIKVKYL